MKKQDKTPVLINLVSTIRDEEGEQEAPMQLFCRGELKKTASGYLIRYQESMPTEDDSEMVTSDVILSLSEHRVTMSRPGEYGTTMVFVKDQRTLSKVDSADASALKLKSDLDGDRDDGLDLNQTIEGQYTILFLGMDESGELSDVDWILQLDLINGTMNILQIPRDCYMPDYASYSTAKFNSIYSGGQETGVTPIQRVVNAIEENFCVYVDCYVKLNCKDIANIVDSIGGIPITLPEEILYEADKVLPAGEQVLDGQQAEWFVRFRHDYAEGDIGRVKAQRIFLAAAMQKMLNMSQTELNKATSDIIAVYVYEQGIINAKYSYSTAVGLFNTVVNIILLIIVNRIAKKAADVSFV